MRKLILHISLFTLLVPASVGLASDGVLEVNQACAVNTGCFSGDAAGLPVTITVAGSYRLTSNLTVPDENTSGIAVGTSDVGIDLNNFSIIGLACVGATGWSCRPTSGTGSGVERTFSTVRSTSVKNGSITGMGNYGVNLGDQAEVTNLRVRWNRLDGISAYSASIISGNTAFQNGDDGIVVNRGSTVSGNTANNNGDVGIYAYFGSTVSGNTAFSNVGDGIYTTDGSTVSGNTAFQNLDDGIHAGIGSTVSDNAAYNNNDVGIYAGTGSTVSGNTANNNGDDGIYAGTGSTVSGNTAVSNVGHGITAGYGATISGNTVRSNTGVGLHLSFDAPYSQNAVTSNILGTVYSGVNMGGNSCNGTTTCP